MGTLGAEVARAQGEALLAVTRGIVAGASRVSRGKGASPLGAGAPGATCRLRGGGAGGASPRLGQAPALS